MVGLRGGVVKKDAIKNGGFGVIVSGISKGMGSSRETAPYSELKSGVKLVIAKNIEKNPAILKNTSKTFTRRTYL